MNSPRQADPGFQSISWKFLVYLLPSVGLVAILVLAAYAYNRAVTTEKHLVEVVQTISEVHSLAVAHPLWTLDFDGLGRSMQTIALHPEIDCVEVTELDSRDRFEWPFDCVSNSSEEQVFSKALSFSERDVGQLNLFFTSRHLDTELKKDVMTGALFFFLLVSVAGIVAFIVLHYTVGRPVKRLIRSIRKAEVNDLPEPVVWDTQDEMGGVISAYNNMIHRVDDNTQELIAAREQAESAVYMKTRFLANMSHELRTPLNAVIGITEMLREEAEEDNSDTEPYDRVAASGRHLLRLIDDILDFSKIEAGKIQLLVEQVDIEELLQEVLVTAKPLADARGNRLVLEYSGTPESVRSDPVRLRQILLNLLSNACKFTSNGTVWLKVADNSINSDPAVHFSVRDTGIGISKEQSEQLFQDFSQADISTTREYGGTGLGLAISQRLCGLLGGEISLQSTVGEGSEFSFTLPEMQIENTMGGASVVL